VGRETNSVVKACAYATLAALIASGCTVVTVDGAHPSTQRLFGTLQIAPTNPHDASVLYSRGFGFVPGHDGLTVGYRRELVITLPAPGDCQMVIVTGRSISPAMQNVLSQLQAKGGNPCVVTSDGRRLRADNSGP
jgi:hypothetical protein